MAHLPLDPEGRGASGPNGAVAAATPEASMAGVEILRQGGNAVDAAVAAGFAAGVLEPNASGLGGGGFMIIRLCGMAEAVVVDFRGGAPGAADPGMFLGYAGASRIGGLAVAVPGETAGLLLALERFGSGKLSRARIMQPAIDWAEGGFPVSPVLAGHILEEGPKLGRFPASAALYRPGGRTLANPELGATLRLIAGSGRDGFYRGAVARRIVDEVRRTGGVLTLEDLAGYAPRLCPPVAGSYRGHTVLSVPPPSSGGVHLIQLLQILENFDLGRTGAGSAATLHLWAEALKLVFADRAEYLADADFLAVPVAGLTAKAYARALAARIDPGKAMAAAGPGDPFRYESGSTTHVSVMDRAGNMVSMTKTINDFFGCGVTVPGTGIVLNDDMDDFDPVPGAPNSAAPGKRPLSSMSPALVLDPAGRPWMTLGSPGGLRIFASTAQILSGMIDSGLPVGAAINAPRLFQNRSGSLELEGRVGPAVREALSLLGHDLAIRDGWDLYFGGAQAVVCDYDRGLLAGGADPRRDGQAAAF